MHLPMITLGTEPVDCPYLFRPAEAARRVALVLTIVVGVDVCGSSWGWAARGANVWKLKMSRVLNRSAMHQQG
jgi:hypothetical protein